MRPKGAGKGGVWREGISEGDLTCFSEAGKADLGDRAMRGGEGALVFQRAAERGGVHRGDLETRVCQGRFSRIEGKDGKGVRAAHAGRAVYARI